jgi:arylformamidase
VGWFESEAGAQAMGGGLRALLRQRMAQRAGQGGGQKADGPKPTRSLSYGPDPLQAIDFWAPARASGPAPIVVFVHGGGWKRGSKDNAAGSYKQVHYPEEGYAYAAINYRLVPQATVEQQAADVAAAVRALLDRAHELGIDRSRVVLMGHSAGAHLVALVGTDERYLRGAGLSLRDVVGVIPLDGAAYDVATQMKEGNGLMQDTYAQAFGTDPARQRALSPVFQAAAPNVAAFLILHVQRKDGIAQAKELELALKKGGTAVARHDYPGQGLQGHAEINREMGNPTYAATPVVDVWLRQVFGR